MKIEFIDHKSKFLKDVISLGNKHSNTLGFMPDGGFIEHAKKKWIIAAHKDNELIGYILFRIGLKNLRVNITHLCIKPEHRGKHIASKLLGCLKDKYQNSLAGIMLSCRSDYKDATRLWEKYGFVSKREVRSRSKEENYLIKWWYDFNKSDLFSITDQNKIKVLLDANIVIKLRDNHASEYNEVKALLADWLSEQVEYYIAPELYNEIRRDSSRSRAEATRIFIQQFKEARLDKDECSTIKTYLEKILPGKTDNDISDRKQVAECIASRIDFFVTGDGPIISKRAEIEANFDIKILNPLEFILEIDELVDSYSYNPTRLSGATQIQKKVDNKKIEPLLDKFLNKKLAESKTDFKLTVNLVLQNIKKGTLKTVTCPINGDIAFWGYIFFDDYLEIKFIRIAENSLATTLITQLISDIINEAIYINKPYIRICDNQFDELNPLILKAFGFSKCDKYWVKVALKGMIASNDLINKFPFVREYLAIDVFENIFKIEHQQVKTKILYEIERKLFPLKFTDLDIPCYIVPIRPYWAGQLFDKSISGNDLFGAKAEKIWNRENIYYRHIKPVTEKTPGRILWYASSEKGFLRQNSIIANSYLDEMSMDFVKIQFRKFKRYGIYEWKDIYKLADNNIDNKVKALRFSDTEVFKNEISFAKITSILLANNRKRNTFTSPLEVNNKIFNEVYKLALS